MQRTDRNFFINNVFDFRPQYANSGLGILELERQGKVSFYKTDKEFFVIETDTGIRHSHIIDFDKNIDRDWKIGKVVENGKR